MEEKKAKLKRKEKDLQVALIQAVYHGHEGALKGAAEALNEHFKKYESPKAKKARLPGAQDPQLKTTGPQMLDFLVECCYERKEIPARCKRRRSPLMIALQDDETKPARPDLARQLILLGSSVAFKNKDGLTALHIACNHGQTDMVRLILETAREQKRFCQKKEGKSLESDLEVVLNAKGGPKGWTALMFAVKAGHQEVVEILTDYNSLDYGIKNKKQQDVFHVAARKGQLECLKLLCKKSPPGALDLLTIDKKGWNILHQVCSSGDLAILEWLLEKEPQLETKLGQQSEAGYTPLLVACKYHKLELVRYLTDKDMLEQKLVDVTACCHCDDRGRGMNGLHLVAENYAPKVARVLIDAGCPLDAVDKEGNTVLHIARKRGDYSVANVVINACEVKGIKLETIKNDDGKLTSEMLEEITYPPEIKKGGKEAKEIYRKALNEGKKKILDCGVLILGKEQVGKTSLYRQMVGKEFREDLDSTKGIDNNDVKTVDTRGVDIHDDNWKEKENPNAGEQFIESLGEKVRADLPSKSADTENIDERVEEGALLAKIRRTVRDIEILKRPPPEPKPRAVVGLAALALQAGIPPPPQPTHTSPPLPKKQRIEDTNATPTQLPFPSPPPQLKVVREERQKQPTQLSTKPPRVVAKDPTPPPQEEPDATPPQPQDEGKVESDDPDPGILTQRQTAQFGKILRRSKDKKDLPSASPLHFNILDFAGQSQYRPMHHCYIARRALYLVVFNCEDMILFMKDPEAIPHNPIEDIRYWVQSINAHIYPPDKDERNEDETYNRVILVGTHRGDHSLDDLKKIDDLIKEKLRNPEGKTINHIYPVNDGLNKLGWFLAVENSIDSKTDNYREESGTKILQENIETITRQLGFMQEEHPIKWLKFQDRLELCKTRNPPVMTMAEAKQLAVQSRITDEDQQELALKFFHDTKRIICLKYLPCLFLSDKEKDMLGDLIILHPQWLIRVMRVIMELQPDQKTKDEYPKLTMKQISQLKDYGKANMQFLKVCWEEFISVTEEIGIEHLCLILQAYCLIHPVSSTSENGDDNGPNFIIPCKLPKEIKLDPLPNASFFSIKFDDFLPAEIYHRLICFASREAKPCMGLQNLYSSKKCQFRYLEGTHWIMEMDSEKHMLHFEVISKKKEKGYEYIQFIHECLRKICKDSRLEGLEYHGGPKCPHPDCKDETLPCVRYVDSETAVSTCKPECRRCLGDFDAIELLCPPKAAAGSSPCTRLFTIRDKAAVLKATKRAAAVWKKVGLALVIDPDELDKISNDHTGCDDQLSAVLSEWLMGNGGERSLKFLCDVALRSELVKRSTLADEVEKELLPLVRK